MGKPVMIVPSMFRALTAEIVAFGGWRPRNGVAARECDFQREDDRRVRVSYGFNNDGTVWAVLETGSVLHPERVESFSSLTDAMTAGNAVVL